MENFLKDRCCNVERFLKDRCCNIEIFTPKKPGICKQSAYPKQENKRRQIARRLLSEGGEAVHTRDERVLVVFSCCVLG